MPTIRLNVDALEIRSFATTTNSGPSVALDRTDYCTVITSAVSETNGIYNCKSCGPCCA